MKAGRQTSPKPRHDHYHRQRSHPLRCFFSFYWGRRKLAIVLIIVVVYILLYHLPEPPKYENNTRGDRPPPEHEVESKPRFLHHSPFRENPDLEYEADIENALKEIERTAPPADRESREMLWQIMLGKKSDQRDSAERSADSVLMEQQNPSWDYKVRRALHFHFHFHFYFPTLRHLCPSRHRDLD